MWKFFALFFVISFLSRGEAHTNEAPAASSVQDCLRIHLSKYEHFTSPDQGYDADKAVLVINSFCEEADNIDQCVSANLTKEAETHKEEERFIFEKSKEKVSGFLKYVCAEERRSKAAEFLRGYPKCIKDSEEVRDSFKTCMEKMMFGVDMKMLEETNELAILNTIPSCKDYDEAKKCLLDTVGKCEQTDESMLVAVLDAVLLCEEDGTVK